MTGEYSSYSVFIPNSCLFKLSSREDSSGFVTENQTSKVENTHETDSLLSSQRGSWIQQPRTLSQKENQVNTFVNIFHFHDQDSHYDVARTTGPMGQSELGA